MIFLGQEEKSVIQIDKDLVINYKKSGDSILVDIKRNLTCQLIWYVVYYDLQKVNNSFFTIIKKLYNENYSDISYLKKDNEEFVKCCNLFLKNCKSKISDSIYDVLVRDIDKLKLVIQKLIYICENICYVDDSEDFLSL